MLKAIARTSNDGLGNKTYFAVIQCHENGKLIWEHGLPVEYLYPEDAIQSANYEIEYLKEQKC